MNWFRKTKAKQLPGGAMRQSIMIEPSGIFDDEVLQNRLWYRGVPAELHQYYTQYDDRAGNSSFWGASSSRGITFRKLHSGLPALVVDSLSDLVCSELLAIRVGNDRQADWDCIAAENHFTQLLQKAVRTVLVEGDGAFKLSVDTELSALPMISFHGSGDVSFRRKYQKTVGIVFNRQFAEDGSDFTLHEAYTSNGVTYTLADEKNRPVPLSATELTRALVPLENPHAFMLAVPLLFDENPRFTGRGKSIFSGKSGVLDALDECVSQWVDALRDGRVQTYIPDGYLPRDAATGGLLRPNAFNARFVLKEEAALEGQTPHVEVVQPDIRTGALLETYVTFLDLCLQGIISPSTLGVDVKKLDNAEAQREKEKATLYTRARLIAVLRDVLPRLVSAALQTIDLMRGRVPVPCEVTVEFGEYANPSFEAQVETIGKAVQSGIMSVEAAIDELYGRSWTAAQKAVEILRLKGGEANE